MTDEEYIDYQGVRLVAQETRVLEEIEELIKKPVPHIFGFDVINGYPFGFAAENNHLTELALNRQKLLNLPASIGTLVHLRLLSLSDNRLRTLPDTIGQLQGLKELNLYNNKLESLPDSIGQLQNLQKLHLGDNQLTSLPESIGQLKSLQELNLSDNNLQKLPETISQLQNLQEIEFYYNSLDGSLPGILNLDSMVTILWLAQKNPIFEKWIPYEVFTHPLVEPLVPDSLTSLSNSVCPFCGALKLVRGLDKKTGKERIFCAECENNIQ